MSMAQVGEFAFIVASLGISLGVTSDFLFSVVVGVSAITTFTTPYMIRLSEPLSKWVEAVLPGKWKNTLTTYSVNTQNIAEISDWKKLLRSYIVNVVVFSVVIIAIILLSTRYIELRISGFGLKIAAAVVSLIVLSPFLWALAFRRTARQPYANAWLKTAQRGPLIILELSRIALSVFYIGLLFYRLFSPSIALIGVIGSGVILALFSKKIRVNYGKIETRFLSNFNEREAGRVTPNEILAPWDTHITRFELSAQSPFIGKTLLESKMREKFGVNIVRIERGDYVINVPNRNNHLYPNDKISVIGTDEQLEYFKTFAESSAIESNPDVAKQNVSLHHFTIHKNSILAGQNIRERSHGLVVGIERNGERILNPESDMVFEANDKVWIVGNEIRIQVIIKELEEQAGT